MPPWLSMSRRIFACAVASRQSNRVSSFAHATQSQIKSKRKREMPVRLGPEGVRFELTRPFGLPVFKTGAFNRSATPPKIMTSDK